MVDEEIRPPFRVVCIDSDIKPDDVENSEWVSENNEYIVTEVFRNLVTGDIAYKLMDKNPDPYKGFRSDRFCKLTVFSVN